MPGNQLTQTVICFGPFEANLQTQELRKHGLRLRLPGQSFQILKFLVAKPGELVTREELQEALWPRDTFVDFEHGVNAAVNRLRETLGDSADHPQLIETLPRLGYRFIGTVAPSESACRDLKVMTERAMVQTGFWRSKRDGGGKVYRSIAVSAVLAVVAAIVFWVFSQQHARSSSSFHLNIFPLTGSIDGESDPAFSPDGRQVAYIAQDEKERNFNVYVKLIGAGQPLRLTSNSEQERFPTWSPDGRYIAFLRNTEQGNDVYLISALGGPEHKLTEAAAYDCTVSWSPDGELLAIADQIASKEPISISVVSLEDGTKRKATWPPPDSLGDVYPAFSPDGHTLAYMRLASRQSTGLSGDIYIQAVAHDAAKTAPRRLTFDNALLGGLDWAADGRSIVFSSRRSGSLRLWQVGLDGSLTQLQEPSDNAAFPSIARRGGRLAYRHDPVVFHGVDLISNESIFQLKPLDPAKSRTPARFCPSSKLDVSPQFSPDGARVVFSSNRSGSGELWLCRNDGSGAMQLTSLGGYSGSPQWSPDGKKVAFDHVAKGGHWEIMVASVEQALPLRVTSRISIGWRPSWSKDGKWIYFGAEDVNKTSQIWKVPSQGGTALQVTKLGGDEARESPDGKLLYYAKNSSPGIWTMPVGGGEATPLLSQASSGFWAVASYGIYFVGSSSSGAPAVKFFDFTTQRITQFALLPEDTRLNMPVPGFTISPDADTILYDQSAPAGNIMVVENFP